MKLETYTKLKNETWGAKRVQKDLILQCEIVFVLVLVLVLVLGLVLVVQRHL